MVPIFALRLIFGMSLTWCVMARKEVTSGFFRIQMLVTMGLAVLATLSLSHLNRGAGPGVAPGMYALTITLAVASFLGSVMWTLERRAAGVRYAMGLLAGSAIGLFYITQCRATPGNETNVPWWLNLLSEYAAGGLIGCAISTMLMGHWYLTATGMPLAPLKQLNQLLLAAVLLRIILVGVVLLGYAPASLATAHWVWMILRAAGLIGPVILVLMVFRILRYRNTQSATGVLYAIDILIFLGEATAALLAGDLHLPF